MALAEIIAPEPNQFPHVPGDDPRPGNQGGQVAVSSAASRVQLHGRVISHVDPDVYVGRAAEVPHERRAFQTPIASSGWYSQH